jgi:hypothetical protein
MAQKGGCCLALRCARARRAAAHLSCARATSCTAASWTPPGTRQCAAQLGATIDTLHAALQPGVDTRPLPSAALPRAIRSWRRSVCRSASRSCRLRQASSGWRRAPQAIMRARFRCSRPCDAAPLRHGRQAISSASLPVFETAASRGASRARQTPPCIGCASASRPRGMNSKPRFGGGAQRLQIDAAMQAACVVQRARCVAQQRLHLVERAATQQQRAQAVDDVSTDACVSASVERHAASASWHSGFVLWAAAPARREHSDQVVRCRRRARGARSAWRGLCRRLAQLALAVQRRTQAVHRFAAQRLRALPLTPRNELARPSVSASVACAARLRVPRRRRAAACGDLHCMRAAPAPPLTLSPTRRSRTRAQMHHPSARRCKAGPWPPAVAQRAAPLGAPTAGNRHTRAAERGQQRAAPAGASCAHRGRV